jgi:hypothetical protein
MVWAAVFILIAVLFNPILPIRLRRSIWFYLDLWQPALSQHIGSSYATAKWPVDLSLGVYMAPPPSGLGLPNEIPIMGTDDLEEGLLNWLLS